MFENLARIMLVLGAILMVLGGIFFLLGRFIPLGKLPGDIFIQRENVTFIFPVVTMIVISLLLTLIFNLFLRR